MKTVNFISGNKTAAILFGSALLMPLISIGTPVVASAQIITTDCETTIIVSGGVVVPNSEITICTSTVTQVADGSQLADSMNNSCGTGNPCTTAPEDTTDPAEAQCRFRQSQESEKDQLAGEIAKDIAKKDPSKEHGTFIVEVDGKLVALDIVSGSDVMLSLNDMRQLYSQMGSRGIRDSQIRGFIHSHPAAHHPSPDQNRDEDFMNGFPSGNDYNAYSLFAENAENAGANRSAWESNFSAYIVGPDGVVREYEEFSRPADQDFSKGIPQPGTPAYDHLSKKLDAAQKDAEGRC